MSSNPMTLDWRLYFELLSEEIRHQSANGDRLARLEAGWPVFRNIAYPLSATPLLVQSQWHESHRLRIRRYSDLLEKLIRLCAAEVQLSNYLGHSDVERRFVQTALRTQRYITICRFDGYLDRATGALKLLEHNSDSPAGTLFSPRLNGLVRALWREVGSPALESRLAAHQFDDEASTRELFASLCRPGRALVVLQEEGKSNVESQEMASAFSAAGLETCVADPRQLVLSAGSARVHGRTAGLFWNKINTVYWRQYVERYPEQVNKWLAILEESDVTHLNHFGARLVTENKRCLALMQEERFAHLFDAAERSLIGEMLPWARKFEPGKQVEWMGRQEEIARLALQEQGAFVIKEPYDIRGDGVTVGLDCSEPQWRDKVAQAMAQGWVLQQYVPPLQLPVRTSGWCPVRQCNLSLDTFVFNGEVAGYGAKASPLHRVNLFKGGQKLGVLVGA